MIRLLVYLSLLFVAPVAAEEVSPGVLRTPDARFEALEDFPFAPNYMMIDGVRIHYLDEGPRDGKPILLLHGEPTWAYLFRTMIPTLTAAGHRVIVPDMAGFGRSDKPMKREDYSYQRHVDMMGELVTRLDLKNITFFGQDWGGLVGLRVVADHESRVSRVMVSNTNLVSVPALIRPVANPLVQLIVWWLGPQTTEELQANFSFPRWIAYAYHSDDLDVAFVMDFLGRITDEQAIKGYEAPYPDGRYKAGASIFPYLIPTQLDENAEAWEQVFEKWEKPFLIAFTDEDPIFSDSGMAEELEARIPGASRVTIKGVGHFVQEEVGPQLAALMNDFIAGREVKGFAKAEQEQPR